VLKLVASSKPEVFIINSLSALFALIAFSANSVSARILEVTDLGPTISASGKALLTLATK
jgi:hypothetical protein